MERTNSSYRPAADKPGAGGWPGAPDGLRERLLDGAKSLVARRNQIVLAAGDAADDVYLVRSGRVRATIFPYNGREVIIRDLGEGQIFGELAAIDRGRRSATIVAIEDSQLAVIAGARFCAVATETPAAALWLVRHLAAQIRTMTARIFELSTLNVRGRLHCELLRMCIERGVSGNAAEIEPAPTHEMLAALIGTHREAVTRELSYLTGAGLISRKGRRLSIRDVAKLSTLVSHLSGDGDPQCFGVEEGRYAMAGTG